MHLLGMLRLEEFLSRSIRRTSYKRKQRKGSAAQYFPNRIQPEENKKTKKTIIPGSSRHIPTQRLAIFDQCVWKFLSSNGAVGVREGITHGRAYRSEIGECHAWRWSRDPRARDHTCTETGVHQCYKERCCGWSDGIGGSTLR